MRFLWYPQNNQGRGGGLQPKPKAEDDNPYWELITLDITKTESNNCFIIHQGHVKVTGNHVVYDRDAWFVRVIMSSSLALFFLPSVKKHKQVFFCFVQCIIKQLLDSVFVISRIIKVSVRVITKTSSNNCLKSWSYMRLSPVTLSEPEARWYHRHWFRKFTVHFWPIKKR